MRLSTDLDSIDLELLRILQSNGRINQGSLAEQVGLSSPAVAERLRKLEDRGIIRGFHAQLDPRYLALDITAFIEVRVDSSTHYPKFLAKAVADEEIMECHAITGDGSHLVKIRTKNTATLEALLAKIQRWPGVVKTRTSLVLSTNKETLSLPLAYTDEVVSEGRRERGAKTAQT